MILRMENYRYPSKDEWLEVSKKFPEITRFGFPYIKDIEQLITRKDTIQGVYIKSNLFEWDLYLSKKIWNLRQSYVNMVVNYNRGLAIKGSDFEDELKVIQLFNFEFYAETSFYYLISVRDIIYQIINIAFNLGLHEHCVTGQNLRNKLKSNGPTDVYDFVSNAYIGLKEANDIRNSLAHKFSKLNSDNRGTLSKNERSYGGGSGYFIAYPKQVEIIDDSLARLKDFVYSIRGTLPQTYNLETEDLN